MHSDLVPPRNLPFLSIGNPCQFGYFKGRWLHRSESRWFIFNCCGWVEPFV
ncbi:hypothetical protein RB7246 [Rhodopirellula baltica SH 1]|uniref:Uncharacterized protein n=1 Tax=Rhodopirellula baltica (strain DSM 10527 / NCIMB 13988 / SH1) TaxID=243090 RepID=Q7UNZ9_RHOBA|nr:hypothetical protein RB7246 [Rhodopirellula baltica SH 1]